MVGLNHGLENSCFFFFVCFFLSIRFILQFRYASTINEPSSGSFGMYMISLGRQTYFNQPKHFKNFIDSSK